MTVSNIRKEGNVVESRNPNIMVFLSTVNNNTVGMRDYKQHWSHSFCVSL